MIEESQRFLKNYIGLLLQGYVRELTFVLATIVILVLDAHNNPGFPYWKKAAIALLILCILYLCYETCQLTRAIAVDINSPYTVFLGSSKSVFRYNVRKQVVTLEGKKLNFPKVKEHFEIMDMDWQYFDAAISDPVNWEDNINEISEHFFLYAHQLPVNINLHLFVKAPSPIVIGMGFTIGKHCNWNVYQYLEQDYKLVSFLRTNQPIKKDDYKYIQVTQEGTDSPYVTLILAIVPPSSIPIPQITSRVIKITSKSQTKIVPTSSFSGIAEEIASVIHNLIREGKTIHLFPGITLPLAFMIGKLLHENSQILIYNPNRDTYAWDSVVDLQALKSGVNRK